VVKLMLGKGDVNVLYGASEGGREKVVELLLGKGADVNAQGGYYGNVLYVTSVEGREKVVGLLLARALTSTRKGECMATRCVQHRSEVLRMEDG
jgi:hypothetical protein